MNTVDQITTRVLNQFRRPMGWGGWLLAWGMNVGHASLTTWGLKHILVDKDAVILDVGCGGGRTVKRLARMACEGKVYGIDFSEQCVAVAKRTNRELIRDKRVEIHQASVSNLPFPAATFDLVTAVETHYFWPDLRSDLQEIRRVLKSGGQLLLLAEAYKGGGGKREDQNQKLMDLCEMNFLSCEEMSELFVASGYTDVQVFDDLEKGWLSVVGRNP